MTVDEYETVRLIDLEGFTQEECAEQMNVARSTVQGIYVDARRKLAEVLVNGKVLLIEGGTYLLCDGSGKGCGRGCRYRGGQGQGSGLGGGEAMGRSQGQAPGRGRGQGQCLGRGQAPGRWRGQGQCLGRGQALGRGRGQELVGDERYSTNRKPKKDAGNEMKIALPVDNKSMESNVCASFGRAPYFLVYDTETKESVFVENTAASSTGGSGIMAAQIVADLGVNALLTPRCGQNAADVFRSADIKLYRANTNSAKDNLEAFIQGELLLLEEFHAGFHGRNRGL